MKKCFSRKVNFLKQTVGFTLTEILLAVMIVGIIGVALASITRAAARESGVGRSKVMLSNNLTNFYRQLRKDLNSATVVSSVAGPLDSASFDSSYVSLIKFIQNGTPEGNILVPSDDAYRVVYCFERGSDSANIAPSDAFRGGKIYRVEETLAVPEDPNADPYPACSPETCTSANLILQNVKYIPDQDQEGLNYPVPLFDMSSHDRLLKVNIITELNTQPIVNEAREQVLTLPILGE